MPAMLKSSVTYKIVATTLALIFLSIAIVAGMMMYNLKKLEMEKALEDTHAAARTMAIIYSLRSTELKVDLNGHMLAGVTAEDLTATADHELVDHTAASIDGVATIFSKTPSGFERISTNVKKSDGMRATGTMLAVDHPAQALLARGEPYFGPAQLFGKDFMTGYFPVINAARQTVGVLFVGLAMDIYVGRIHHLQLVALFSGLVALMVSAGVAVASNRALLKPLGKLIEAVGNVSEGRLDRNIPYSQRRDEFGKIAKALDVFRGNASERLRLEAETEAARVRAAEDAAARQSEEDRKAGQDRIAIDGLTGGLVRLADGDLTYRIEEPFAPHLEDLRKNFNESVSRLQEALRSVGQTAASINSGAKEFGSGADDLSKRTEKQAASVEETAAALEQITTTVRNAAARAAEVGSLVSRTRVEAEKSGEVVRDAVEAMDGIKHSSGEIGSIVGVIDEIAFQTNLLALNAGVEAARAGDAGKGFAVVAQEVRELAQRSASAAKEIKTLISRSNGQVQSGVALVGQAGQALATIVAEVKEISGHVNAIVDASREQSIGLQEISTAVNSMDQGTQQNAAMVEQSTAASHSLASEVHHLNQLLLQFKVGASGAARPQTNQGPIRSPQAA
jgi:methyl-accepting chemotaxis protein